MEDFQHQQMGYDRTATMFAPGGHIMQVEYAEKAVRLGSASIGLVCKDGVVLVSDRRQRESLIVESSANKIHEVDDHIACVFAGISSDARILIDKARVMAQQHQVTFDSPATTESIVKEIADVKQQFTHYGGARPFGVSLMFAGINGEPSLYVTDVTGNYLQYKANAIGENDTKIKEKLKEKYKEGLSISEGIKLALDIFKTVQKDEHDINRFDAGILQKEQPLKKVSGKAIESL